MASKVDRSKPGWLADMVRRDIADREKEMAERAAKYVRKPKSEKLPRYVPLQVWAEIMFGEFAPSITTLRKWMVQGHIYPPPRKIGGRFYVSPDADYME